MQTDGSMSRADAEETLRRRDIDLWRCDAQRKAGADAWPVAPRP
jgi:hypothetical protein